jgi:hypothetical protein
MPQHGENPSLALSSQVFFVGFVGFVVALVCEDRSRKLYSSLFTVVLFPRTTRCERVPLVFQQSEIFQKNAKTI